MQMRLDKLQKHSHNHNSLNHKSKKRNKLIQETFGTCPETQQRKQLTIKKLLHLINNTCIKFCEFDHIGYFMRI